MQIDTELNEQRAKVFKALGHPSRMAMVDAVLSGERCVCELRDLVGADISTVSRHLAVLKNAGVLKDRKEGTSVYYSLNMPCVKNFLACLDAFLGHPHPLNLADLTESRQS